MGNTGLENAVWHVATDAVQRWIAGKTMVIRAGFAWRYDAKIAPAVAAGS